MRTPTLQEIAYIKQQFYNGDEDDRKCYHFDIHCLLNFNGVEVVTVFSVNEAQIAAMDLEIPNEFPILRYREKEYLGEVNFEEIKRSTQEDERV